MQLFFNVEIYFNTKLFPSPAKIIATSGLWKRTSAISEFHFRFWFWATYRHGHGICMGVPNFIQIGQCTAELWRHMFFQDGGHRVGNLLPASVFSERELTFTFPIYTVCSRPSVCLSVVCRL